MKRDYGFSDISSGLLRKMMIPALLLGAAAARAGTLTHEVQIDLNEIRGTVKEYAGEEFMVFEPKTLDLTSEEGKPMLPVKYIRLAVPTYASNFRVSTQSVPAAESEISYRVFPCQKPVRSDFEGTIEFNLPDSTFYSQDEWTDIVKYSGTGFLEGDQQIVTVAVHPLSYNPKLNRVKIFDNISLRLDYDIAMADSMQIKPIAMQQDIARLSNLWNLVDNKTEAESFYSPPAHYRDPMRFCKYYIITAKKLSSSFERLAKWKRVKGYDVEIISVEDIIADPKYAAGDSRSAKNDDASKIRAFLRDKNEQYGAFYVLFGGDASILPIFYAQTHEKVLSMDSNGNLQDDNTHITPTDLYFCDLSTDWKLNSEGNYSQYEFIGNNKILPIITDIDFAPEIYVGRILCTTPEHVRNYVDKLICYERLPGNGDTSYLDKALYTNDSDSYNRRTFIHEGEEVRQKIESMGFFPINKVFLDPDNIGITKGIDVISELRNKYGFISFSGHGNSECIVICDSVYYKGAERHRKSFHVTSLDEIAYKNDIPFGKTGINGMQNEFYPTIAMSMSCMGIPFDNVQVEGHTFLNLRICDSFTINGNYGGPAFLGHTRYGYAGSSYLLEKQFFEWLPSGFGISPIGVAEALSRWEFIGDINDNYTNHVRLTHNLIGDPEFSMWVNAPSKLENIVVSIDDENISLMGSNLHEGKIVYTDCEGNVDRQPFSYFKENGSTFTDWLEIKNPIVSIWSKDTLPYSFWLPEGQRLEGSNKEMIIDRVELGSENPADESEYFIIGKDSNIDMEIFNCFKTNEGFSIEDGGRMKVLSHCDSYINGSKIENGAVMEISAPSITVNPGFNAEKGAIIILNNGK